MINSIGLGDVFQGTGDLLVETEPDPGDFLIAIDPGHFRGTGGRRTPQMPDLRLNNAGNFEPYWDSGNTNSSLATEPPSMVPPPPAPTVTTPDGVIYS